MIGKIYKCIAVIVSIYFGIQARSFREMFYTLLYFFMLYIGLKAFFTYLKYKVRSAGGPLRWFMDQVDTTRNDQQIIDSVWNSFQSSGDGGRAAQRAAAQRAADQRVRDRTRAANEAAYHQYYANLNKGTYDGYRSQNRANAARDRANRY